MILRLVNGTADPTAKLGPARYSTPATAPGGLAGNGHGGDVGLQPE